MGQRSQIYIRWQKENGDYVLIARYFQWNFAERMISRARALLEVLSETLEYDYQFSTESFVKKITAYCDINFDYRDIVQSCDIIKEYEKYDDNVNFKDYVFLQQDNNDGQLYIDVDVKNKTIKYCLTEYCAEKVLNCREYMSWDYKNWSHNLDSYHYSYTIDNLEFIEKNFSLMTKKEIKDFISYDYKGD
jgi:hypothetical protein